MRKIALTIYRILTVCIGIASGAVLLWGFSKLFGYNSMAWWKNLLFTDQGYETISMWIQLACLGLTPIIVSVILLFTLDGFEGFFTRLFIPIVAGFLVSVAVFCVLMVIGAFVDGNIMEFFVNIIICVIACLIIMRPTVLVMTVIVSKK